MKKWNYKWLLLIVFSIYSLLIFVWGDTGINAMKTQLQVQDELIENIRSLLAINEGLNRELELYRTDTETIMIQARNLGYINEDEKILFINDLPKVSNIKKPGDVIIPENEIHSIENILKFTAILISIAILFASSLWQRRMRSE